MMTWMAGARACLGVVALVSAMQLHAQVFEVTVHTEPLEGTDATLAFDLFGGDAPASSLTIFDFGSIGGSLGEAFFIHDDITSAPTLANTVTLDETGFFNQYQQQLTLGTSFTFRFSTTGTDLGDPSTPDAFSFFLLDDAGLASLVQTGDPSGSQAILRYEIGRSSVPELFSIIEPVGVTVESSEVTTAVPEPGIALLVLAAFIAMSFGRLFKRESSDSGNIRALF